MTILALAELYKLWWEEESARAMREHLLADADGPRKAKKIELPSC